MRTVFIECDRFLSRDEHRAMLENMKYEAGDDVRIVLLAPGMRVAEPAPQWIPVSERLPELCFRCDEYEIEHSYSEHVLICTDHVMKSEGTNMFTAVYALDDDKTTGYFFTPIEWVTIPADRVIAWMPLPEPYKEAQT